MRNTVATFRQAKGQHKLTMLTAYDYTTARIMDEAGVNSLLVGDSLGMVMLGHENTLSVTVDDMVHHCAPVARAAASSLVVCDMPFMSYHVGVEDTLRNAGRLMAEGHAHAVKLEGGTDFCGEIRALVRASIPVMGHVGLTPQSVHMFGGFKVQGKTLAAAQKLLDDARAIQDAGVFALVLEGVPAPLGSHITHALEIPVIGIGAGADCDGQVLVWQDMMGLSDLAPKFVKKYAQLGTGMREAIECFSREVAEGSFPDAAHSYAMDNAQEILAKLR